MCAGYLNQRLRTIYEAEGGSTGRCRQRCQYVSPIWRIPPLRPRDQPLTTIADKTYQKNGINRERGRGMWFRVNTEGWSPVTACGLRVGAAATLIMPTVTSVADRLADHRANRRNNRAQRAPSASVGPRRCRNTTLLLRSALRAVFARGGNRGRRVEQQLQLRVTHGAQLRGGRHRGAGARWRARRR